MKIQLRFKNPDAIHDIGRDQVKGRSAAADEKRDEFYDTYFEHGDYGRIEVDTKTLACRLLPVSEWEG